MNNGSGWSFIEHITKSLSRKRGGDPKPPTLWPSEASAVVNGKVVGKCRRATFFRFMLENYSYSSNYKVWATLADHIKKNQLPVEPYLLWIWRQGELYEDFVVEEAKISGVFLEGQTQVYIPDYNVSGKKDLEVLNPLTGKRSIVEVKSVYGFGGNVVLGTPSERRKGGSGKPKDPNLMQTALYHWWHASEDDAYEESRLVYGSRDTGRYGEYLVKTENVDGVVKILYKPHTPNPGAWVTSGITINSILEEYRNQQLWLDAGTIPPRDFNILYGEEELAELYAEGELNKTEVQQYEKVLERREENKIAIQNGDKPKKELKQIEKGHFQCGFCPYSPICYNKDNTPRDL